MSNPIEQLALAMAKTQNEMREEIASLKAGKEPMIKITTTKGEDIYLNPSFITAVRPDKDETTEIHYFASTSFVGTNLAACWTHDSVESIVKRINNQ